MSTFKEDYALAQRLGIPKPDPAHYGSSGHRYARFGSFGGGGSTLVPVSSFSASVNPGATLLRPSGSSQFLGLGPVVAGIGGTLLGGVVDAAGDWLKGKFGGSGTPALPALPGLPQLPSQPVAATPAPGLGGMIQRVLPGGKSGYVNSAVAGLNPVIEVQYEQRAKVPRGYVVVMMPDGSKVGMYKSLARSLGLWKSRPKPPVSGWDMKAIRRADRAQKRVKKLAGQVGYTCREKGRAAPRRRSKC